LAFSGSNDRAVLALCRGFERYGVPFGLLARGADDLLSRSRYANRFLATRRSEELVADDLIEAARQGNRMYGQRNWVICATSEYINLRLFDLQDELARHAMTVATCEKDLYHRLSHKFEYRTYCAEVGVPGPALLDGIDAARAPLAFVAKPKVNLSVEGRILYPYLVRTATERERFLREADPAEYYLERFVVGESWYLLYYFAADGHCVQGAQRNLLQQGEGKSIVVARAGAYPVSAVPRRFAEALRQDGYRGFIMLELRRTPAGETVSIEANPRCWGPFQLTMDAHMGLIEAFLRDHGHAAPSPLAPRVAQYAWSGGILQALRRGMGLDRYVGLMPTVVATARALANDVYARNDSWSCFLSDLCRR
jgi:hypothetical protein